MGLGMMTTVVGAGVAVADSEDVDEVALVAVEVVDLVVVGVEDLVVVEVEDLVVDRVEGLEVVVE